MFNILKKKKKEEEKATDKKGTEEKGVLEVYKKEIEENVAIHTMPERFRLAHGKRDKAKQVGMLIIIGGVLFLIVASFLLYYFLIRKAPPKSPPAATSTPAEEESVKSEPPKTEEKPAKAPKESYLEMKKEFEKAKGLSQLLEVVKQYAVKNRVEEIEKYKEEISKLPNFLGQEISTTTYAALGINETSAGIGAILLESAPRLKEMGEITEKISGSTAILSVFATTTSFREEGTIKMAIEDNTWKLDSEKWRIIEDLSAKIAISTPENFVNGADSDNDGLTNKEEVLFGSSGNNTDSDQDTYYDLAEVLNLYNPAGAGKLEASAAIKKYENVKYKYSLLYPSAWLMSAVGGDDSIILKSSDNHFVQIITQSNSQKQTIENWYRAQFSVMSVGAEKKVAVGDWQGIRSEDNLVLYLTDKDRKYIYTITYNSGESNTLEYKNIFEMIIKSFMIKS